MLYSNATDPAGQLPPPEGGPAPGWILVGDTFVDATTFDDDDAWAAAVLAAACDVYAGAAPAGCP